jgi:hypothetical protein
MIVSPSGLKDGAVVASKIATGAVTDIKLSSDFMKKIGETTLTGAGTTIQFTGLDLATDGLYMLVLTTDDNVAGNGAIRLEYNGDTTVAHYYTNAGNTADFNGYNSGDTQMYVIFITRDPAGYPVAFGSELRGTNTSLAALINVTHVRNDTTNVTSIELVASNANAMKIGTRCILMKPMV